MDGPRQFIAIDPLPSGAPAGVAAGSHPRWETVLRLLRRWLKEHPARDAGRASLFIGEMLIEELMRTNDYSSDAAVSGCAILCVNCRRLDASQGKCSGQPLNRCPLLKGEGI